MIIIGCDYHPSFQQIAFVDSETGEFQEQRLTPRGEVITHPGVGALTALAFVLVIGDAERFRCGKQIASYLSLVPAEIPVANTSVWGTSAWAARSPTAGIVRDA